MANGHGLLYRALSAWIAVAALIVPHGRRRRWAEEWRAEMWHALDERGPSRLSAVLTIRHALGALSDAWHARRTFIRTEGASRPSMLRGIGQDLRLAARTLRRSPGFAVFTISILSLGIGVNTAVLSLARDALVGALPFPDADRLVHVWERRPTQGRERNVASFPDFMDWRERSTSFSGMAAVQNTELNASGGQRPLPVFGSRVTEDFLSVVGVEPALGRGFDPEEMQPPGAPVVILGHGLWTEMFAADREVLGQTLRLDLEPHTIIGVMPAGFAFPHNARFWLPLGQDPVSASRGSHGFDVVARMLPGVTVERAWSDLDVVARQLEESYPSTNTGHYAAVYPLRGELLGETQSALFVLLGAVGLVLTIVCVNVAILELARSVRRSRELAVRATMGATPARLVRQVLAESAVLAMVSGVLAVGVGAVTHALLARLSASSVPWGSELRADVGTLGTVLLLAFATSFLFGLAPALQATRLDLSSRLKEGSLRGGLSRAARRWQGSLIVAQVALALLLLIGAGGFGRNLLSLLAIDVGYETQGIVTADVSLPDVRYGSDDERIQFYQALEELVRSEPAVQAVGTAWILPMSGRNVGRNFLIDGRAMPESDELSLRLRAVSPTYFDAIGMRLLGGRGIESTDAGDAPLVAVASKTLVERYWRDADPIGQRIAWGQGRPWITIVGVVNEVRHDGPNNPAEPELYLPLAQAPPRGASIVVRSAAPLDVTSEALRSAITELDSDQAVARIGRLEDTLSSWLSRQKELTNLVLAFALVALILAALGIYSVVAYTVSLRTREFGIRLALGGRTRQVLAEAMAGGTRLVVLGLFLGLFGALALSRVIGSLVMEVPLGDAPTLLVSFLVLGSVGTLAIFVPARRATRVDPVRSLNSE